jgi:uracil-DNA glycosylase
MSNQQARTDVLAEFLAWGQAMGADTVVAGEATDWLARGPVAPGAEFAWPASEGLSPHSAVPEQATAAPRAAAVAPQSSPAQRAAFLPATPVAKPVPKPASRAAAVEANSLSELEAKLRAFDGCGLKATATNLCFYRGAPTARLMIIGEAPGRDEDLEGRPFVGRAGQLLDKMLTAIGLDEHQVHITNIVYWRPPGNRTPSPQEALACRPFLERQAQLVNPDVLLLLGGAATKHVLDTEDGIMRLRGKWSDVQLGGKLVKTMATLHPAYLLRTPAAKRQVWRDLLAIKEKLT